MEHFSLTTQQLDVLKAMEQFPLGAALEQIETALAAPPNRRTLQRWLGEMIHSGLVRRAGGARASRYFAKPAGTPPAAIAPAVAIPLSAGAEQVLAHVSQPLPSRTPVGYRRAFLDAYRPNETYYLPQPIRDELMQQGQGWKPS